MERRLAAILATDMVGFSRLMGEDETATLAALQSHLTELIEPKVAEFRGRIVKLLGDGALVEFASVVDAVGCGVAIQEGMAERAAMAPENRRIEFRIGINIGDVLVDGDDIFGDCVNLAARLEGLADPGGICISETVYEATRNKLDVKFEDLGERDLKNIAEPVRVFRILIGEARRSAPPSTRPKPPRLEQARGSIAVFPFDSLSPDAEDAYLADGIATEIINMLSRVPDLRVASRSAIFATRGHDEDAWDLVRDLQFRYVLTGNVRRAGDRLRVIAELTEAADRTQLWSNTYDRRFADLFSVQEEIAEAIVIAFGGEYLRVEWRRASQRPTENLDAWGLVQKARSLNLPVNREAMDDALTLAREAVELDPTYAGAHACVASVLLQRVLNGISLAANEDRAEALAAVERAAELAPNDPTVLRTLGNVQSNCGEHAQAVAALRRAVDIAPFDFHSWGRLGRTLAYGGNEEELREGHAILDRILASAPNHPMVPYWLYFKANACASGDRFEDAERFARKSLELQPGYAGAWVALANALGHQGRTEEARQAMDRARRVNPDMTPEHLAEQIRITASRREESAEKSLAGLRMAGLL